MLKRQVSLSVYNVAKPYGGTKSKEWVTVLLACSEDGSDKLPF
jgi:hypothetical protein